MNKKCREITIILKEVVVVVEGEGQIVVSVLGLIVFLNNTLRFTLLQLVPMRNPIKN